uniref:Uncharacterized protein n=1 Tax=Anguilla anguilla TaxID=7936 RepID=A0A0E9UX36_ANGAN
MLKRWPYN